MRIYSWPIIYKNWIRTLWLKLKKEKIQVFIKLLKDLEKNKQTSIICLLWIHIWSHIHKKNFNFHSLKKILFCCPLSILVRLVLTTIHTTSATDHFLSENLPHSPPTFFLSSFFFFMSVCLQNDKSVSWLAI